MPTQSPYWLRFIHELPRWFLLALLIWAPWCYGSTRTWSADLLGLLMVSLGFIWLISLLLERRKPRLSWFLIISAATLLLQGWGIIANADHRYNRDEFRFEPVEPLVSWLPGAADTLQAVPIMLRYTGILLVFLFVADLTQRSLWRSRIGWTIGLAGLSLIVFGIVRKILGLQLVSAETFLPGETSFATYYYHGNAGAFVNLVFPFVWMLAALSWRRGRQVGLAIWFPAVLLCIGASVVIASKAAMVITGLLVVALIGLEFAYHVRRNSLSLKHFILYAVLTFAAVGAAVAFGWTQAAGRWAQIADSPQLTGVRLIAYKACLTMLPDSGWWGFGPGNFSITFPHYTSAAGDKIRGFWAFAHEDYLQTLIEWGWFGAFFWSVILIGALTTGIRTIRRRHLASADQAFVLAALLSLLGVAAHAAVDFPLQIASLQLYAAVATGILWGSRNITVSSRHGAPGRDHAFAFSTGAP